jgi:Na+/proline symporter
VLVFIPGLAMVALDPALEHPDHAVPTLIRRFLPPGLTGLMFAAFFAALMSSIDSYLNSCSTVFTSDIYLKAYRWIRGGAPSEGHVLILGRVFTAALIILAGIAAPVFQNQELPIYVFIQNMLSYFQGPTLAILLLGILWRRATGIGALVGFVSGVMATIGLSVMGGKVFPSDNPFLFVSFWSFLFSLAVTVLASLLTPPEPIEKLRGLVWRLVIQKEAAAAGGGPQNLKE